MPSSQTNHVHYLPAYTEKMLSRPSMASCQTFSQSCDTPTPEILLRSSPLPFPSLFKCCLPVTSMPNAAVMTASTSMDPVPGRYKMFSYTQHTPIPWIALPKISIQVTDCKPRYERPVLPGTFCTLSRHWVFPDYRIDILFFHHDLTSHLFPCMPEALFSGPLI